MADKKAGEEVKVLFRIPYDCQFGYSIEMSGSHKELGNWDPTKTRRMYYSDIEKFWELEIATSAKDSFDYKYCVKDDYGNITAWESGDNRIHVAPASSGTYTGARLIEHRDFWKPAKAAVEHVLNTTHAFTKAIYGRDPSSKKPASPAPNQANPNRKANTTIVRFKLINGHVTRDQSLFICGSSKELGSWNAEEAVGLLDFEYPEWNITLHLPNSSLPLEYKYIIRSNDGSVEWESGPNRVLDVSRRDKDPQPSEQIHILDEGYFRTTKGVRCGGVAIPVFSLRTATSFGVGDFLDIKKMVDWSVSAGLKFLQILPVNDTRVTNTWWDSYPYSSISVFALHPIYLNLDALDPSAEIKKEIQAAAKKLNTESLQYEETVAAKLKFAKQVFKTRKAEFVKEARYKTWFEENEEWLQSYALFTYLKDKFNTANYHTWPKYSNITQDEIDKLTQPNTEFYEEILFTYFLQYHLSSQLSQAAKYAEENGVAVKGDLPIGVDPLSVDTWRYRGLFRMNKQTGAPPDAFSADGQNWGFPTYNWEAMAKDDYAWWRLRLKTMAKYFHAYRIDHILGFFRIWEIPGHCVGGLMGRFYPSIPVDISELHNIGAWDINRLTDPYIRVHTLVDLFGHENVHQIVSTYFEEYQQWHYRFKPQYDTEQKIEDAFDAAEHKQDTTGRSLDTKRKLVSLLRNVILLKDDDDPYNKFYFRIEMMKTSSYLELPDWVKWPLYQLYINFFFRRQDDEWAKRALQKLPMMQSTTHMLVCGEDLGMIPDCVQGVLDALAILGLRVQRMPKDSKIDFDIPSTYPYLTVGTTGTHDTSTLRGWWEEDRAMTEKFYREVLQQYGHCPQFCEPYIAQQIVEQHFQSPSIMVILPLQDLFAMDTTLRTQGDPNDERINIPAVRHHYWKYRMHLSLEDLIKNEAFTERVKSVLTNSNRI